MNAWRSDVAATGRPGAPVGWSTRPFLCGEGGLEAVRSSRHVWRDAAGAAPGRTSEAVPRAASASPPQGRGLPSETGPGGPEVIISKRRTIPPSRAVGRAYKNTLEDPLKGCGKSISLAACDFSHLVGAVLWCGRDWCPTCGQEKSNIHRRRYARLLPRVQQLEHVGLFVVTWPERARQALRHRATLAAVGKTVAGIFKKQGFVRGLRRWHWFGEAPCPNCGNRQGIEENEDGQGATCSACGRVFAWRDSSPVWHPHLNVLVDAGFISPEKLAAVKEALRAKTGAEVVNYNYAANPGGTVHKVRYLTRATFRGLGVGQAHGGNLGRFPQYVMVGGWPVVGAGGLEPSPC